MGSCGFNDWNVLDYILNQMSTLITLNLRYFLLLSVDLEGLSSGW